MEKYRIGLVIYCLLFFSNILNAQTVDKDLSIRQIIEKYYPKQSFYFGCTSKTKYLKEEGIPEKVIFLREFSYNTPENEFKQSLVIAEPNAAWKSEIYKQLLMMARENNQTVRAHCPISPQCSKWAMEDHRTAAELKNMMTVYMTNLSKDLEANKDVVKWMDVVNETVSPNNTKGIGYNAESSIDSITYKCGDWFGPRLGTESWENPWPIMGFVTDTPLKVPVYIKLAFELANQYAPSIKKLYNHHGGMEDAAWDKIKKTVLYLRSKGLKVDAIGWQAHIPYGFEKVPGNMDRLNNLIDWCFQNKLEFHVTEMDIKMGKDVVPEIFIEKANDVADTYGAITEALLKKRGVGAVGINIWTLTHRFRKNEGSFAGLFGNDLTPTPAYYRVKEILLKNAPVRITKL